MKIFIQQYFHLLKRIGLPVLLLTLTASSFEQLISLSVEDLMKSPEGPGYRVWTLALFSLFTTLLFQLFMSLFILFGLKPDLKPQNGWLNSAGQFFSHYGQQSLIETMRAWGKAFIYFFLFIIPGLWKILQYSFVPWIVCFHPQYDKGELDALQGSSKVFSKNWVKVLLILVVFSGILPSLLYFFEDKSILWITPGPALTLNIINSLLHILNFQILSIIFFKYLKEEHYEPVF